MLYKSAMTTQASGSVGGMVASRNRGGNYMRARAIPTNPNTMLQAAVREGFGMLSNMWAVLTEPQRAGWNSYADNVMVPNVLGDQIKLSGFNQFIRSNTPRQQAGLSIAPNAPTTFNIGETPQLTGLVVQAGGVTPDLTLEFVATPGNELLVYLSRPLQATINFYRGPYRFAVAQSGTGGDVVIDEADYPFPYAIGNKVRARATITYGDGRLSAEAQIDTIVVIGA